MQGQNVLLLANYFRKLDLKYQLSTGILHHKGY